MEAPLRRIACCSLILGLWMALPATSQKESQKDSSFAPGQVIVLVEPGVIRLPPGVERAAAREVQVAAAPVRRIFARHGVTKVRQLHSSWSAPSGFKVRERRKGDSIRPDELTDLSHYYVLDLPLATDVRAVVAELDKSEGIVLAEPNYRVFSLAAPLPNDPKFANNWGFYNPAQPNADVNAPDAWAIQPGRETVKIAILDTGIERSHPDFGGGAKIAAEYDFVHDDANASPDLDISAPYHGTAVAGVAAAETNDGFGVAGLCGGFGQGRGCSILAAKILGNLSIVQDVTEWLGLTDLNAEAVNWSIANGALVLNNSWCNSEVNFTTHDSLRNAYQQGILVTAAMGNTEPNKCGQSTASTQVAPAAFADILMAVGATNSSGNRVNIPGAWQSAVGPHISVVAPGLSHWSDDLNGGTRSFSGTSEATPFVSGLAGLLWSEAQAKGLSFTPWDVRQIIQLTARDLEAAGHDSNTGHGLIDAGKALQVLQPPNQLTYATLGPAAATCFATTPTTNWTFWGDHAVYLARRCELRRGVTFAKQYTAPPLAWGRPVANGGITPSNPNSQVFFTGILPGSVTSSGATLRTYVYERWTLGGTYLGWYPVAPNQVNWGYAVLGQPVPPPPPPTFTVTASAPGLVTVKATYALNGSANAPASNWKWERRDDGGAWSTWATAQNSQFVAFAGTYTIDWRLSARRNSDGATASTIVTTQVCIPSSPGCLQ